MATTQYIVKADGVELELEKPFNKKSTAVDFANKHRDENKVAVSVETTTGKEVMSAAAPKKIKMSPQYSRVVELDEGIEVPEGFRVAYKRPRAGLAVLHDTNAEKGSDKQYAVMNLKTGKVPSRRFATTRQCGDFMTEQAEKLRAAKAEQAVKDAADKAKETAKAVEQAEAPAPAEIADEATSELQDA